MPVLKKAASSVSPDETKPKQDLQPNWNDLLDTKAAAEYIHHSASTLETWRSTKRYPLRYRKIGRRVLYLRSDLDAFLAAAPVGGI